MLGSVVRRPICANPWLNFILGFFISLFKNLYKIIFSTPFRASSYQIADKKIVLNFLLAYRSEIRFQNNLGLSY